MVRKLSILGPGLLGGSIGLAARQRKVAERVAIWARRPEAADEAYKVGAADEASTDLAKTVADADLVVLATPIGAMRGLVEKIRFGLRDGCVVTDVGSVKYPIVVSLSEALAGPSRSGASKARFVGSHPMAGSEQAGIEAARRDLFDNAVCIVTPTEGTDKAALQIVHDFWKALGCSVKTLAPAEHDEIVARISHLPHVVAAAVINVVCNDGEHPLNFVGPGFKDFTRIASGPFEMWTEICLENREEIGRALDQLIEELGKVRAAVANGDAVELRTMLKRAKHFRDELRFRT
ncbi:MAG TPA: prephenate dehydrogenase/arogenate dehydrogenase family protein [Verrucomicrobiae bacterium]|nr:prephenate dehydrogenase/arogenate dehydrogenase family protein [Verrucomicrobiae bacterium]